MLLQTNKDNIFNGFLHQENIFVDKNILSASFVPENIPHRSAEISQLSSILAPALRGYSPNNVFVYGTCGTGKTITTKFVLSQLSAAAKAAKARVRLVYVNCKMKKVADTEYRLFAHLLKEFGEDVPDTGLPTDSLYRRFFDVADESKAIILLALDEIDTLVRKVGDDFLYNFTRINSDMTKSHITTIGITNDLGFRDRLDLRVKSSLSEEEVLFRPYNALQLRDILAERALLGFRKGAFDDVVLAKCAALAAQEHGDARRALDLLRVAGEITERNGDMRIMEQHVDRAQQKIDVDRITETVRSQPRQSQAVLYAAITLREKARASKQWGDRRLLTGDIYDAYTQICAANGMNALTQRRVSDLIGELDMLGIITAKVISKGRYGRTREIIPVMNEDVLQNVKCCLSEHFLRDA